MSTPSEGLVTAEVPTAAPARRADAVRVDLLEGSYRSIDPIWVVDGGGELVGIVSVASLLRAAPDTRMGSLATAAPLSVDIGVDQERIALHSIAGDMNAVPVTRDGRFVGVVPARALLQVLHTEHLEDLHRLVGIAVPRDAGDAAPPTAVHRLPWLVVGLAGSLVAGAVMGGFEETLHRDMAVAYFVPAIVYVADAVGTQTEALVVRSLALGRGLPRRAVLRELGTGAILGLVLGGLAAPAVGLLWGNSMLGCAVGISALVACSLATSIGMVLPWALSRAGVDPALGSGPLATILQDVLSIVVYLAVVRMLL